MKGEGGEWILLYPYHTLSQDNRQQTTGSAGSERDTSLRLGYAWDSLGCYRPLQAITGPYYRPICESSVSSVNNHGRVTARECCACSLPPHTFVRTCTLWAIPALISHLRAHLHAHPTRTPLTPPSAVSGVVAAGTGAPRLAGIWLTNSPA